MSLRKYVYHLFCETRTEKIVEVFQARNVGRMLFQGSLPMMSQTLQTVFSKI